MYKSRSSDEIVVLSRDSFAREEVIRTCEVTTSSCAWCGNTRKSGKMFYYGTQDDNYNTYWHSKPFCCKSCHDSYYN